MRFHRPKTSVVAALTAALALLAACGDDSESAEPGASATPAASGSQSGTPTPTPSKVSVSTSLDAIKASGDFGDPPKVTFKAPFAVDKTRSEDLVTGDGPTVAEGDSVEVSYAGYNGRTGKQFDESFSGGQPVTFSLSQVVPGFSKGLVGHRQGSRVLIAMPGSDGYDGSGGNPQIDVQVGDTLVFVVDLVGVPLDGPDGEAVKPKAGLPTVTDKDGVPEVTIPKADPPATLQIQPLIKGEGPVVAETDTITFNYRWYAWDGRLLEQSYGAAPASYALSGLLPGMQKGLVDQTVGSRVLLVIPPAEGYPDGNATPKVEAGETLVIVVDLLFTQAQ